MTVRDEANNSRVTRRFVLYDPISNISLNSDDNAKLFVSSADKDSGYQWQTTVSGNINFLPIYYSCVSFL